MAIFANTCSVSQGPQMNLKYCIVVYHPEAFSHEVMTPPPPRQDLCNNTPLMLKDRPHFWLLSFLASSYMARAVMLLLSSAMDSSTGGGAGEACIAGWVVGDTVRRSVPLLHFDRILCSAEFGFAIMAPHRTSRRCCHHFIVWRLLKCGVCVCVRARAGVAVWTGRR